MKIALVTETFLPAIDGVVTRLLHAVDYMIDQGHEIVVLCPKMDGLPQSYRGAKLIGMTSIVPPFYKSRPWGIPSRKVKTILADFQPDLVHAVNPLSLAASGARYADQLDLPLVCSFHTNIPEYLSHYHLTALSPVIWKYIRSLHNLAEMNLVTSQAMYDELDDQDINNIKILPKGVDVDNCHPRFYSKNLRNNYLSNSKNKLLIFVGRLAPEKNIDSLRPLFDERDDFHLCLIGDGPDRARLEKIFEGTDTTFTGFLTGEELSQYYASADAFLFPSTTETLGLVILEALSSGTPVIASYSEPTAEQINNGENGLLYTDGNYEELHECLDLLDEEKFVASMQEEAIAYASQFSWHAASKKMLEAYEETVTLHQEKKLEKTY